MSDLLVRLYDLPPAASDGLAEQGIRIRHAMPYEKESVVSWVRTTFSARWAGECDVAFARQPVSCFLAIRERGVIGFACYESTARGFFGPIGVAPDRRTTGIGRALLLACLHAMREMGYAYAIIGGGSGALPFYAKVAGATEIPGSHPGLYVDMLR